MDSVKWNEVDVETWEIWKATLPHWSKSKLVRFNTYHLGEAEDWDEKPHADLIRGAASVIDAHIAIHLRTARKEEMQSSQAQLQEWHKMHMESIQSLQAVVASPHVVHPVMQPSPSPGHFATGEPVSTVQSVYCPAPAHHVVDTRPDGHQDSSTAPPPAHQSPAPQQLVNAKPAEKPNTTGGQPNTSNSGHDVYNAYNSTQTNATNATQAYTLVPTLAAPKAKPLQYCEVVFSYQSKHKEFLFRLRDWLNAHGVPTVDGTQVPAGEDWRRFYFPKLHHAKILLPLMSESFLFSRACEDEITYAYDNRKKIIPINAQPTFTQVLRHPERFTGDCEDIEIKAPKIGAMLQGANCVPSSSRQFDADDNAFEENCQRLLQAIQKNCTAMAVEQNVPTPAKKYTNERKAFYDQIAEAKVSSKQAADQEQRALAQWLVAHLGDAGKDGTGDIQQVAYSEALSYALDRMTNSANEEHAKALIEAGAAQPLAATLSWKPAEWLGKDKIRQPDIEGSKEEAAGEDRLSVTQDSAQQPLCSEGDNILNALNIIRTLASVGGPFGSGHKNFRKTFCDEGGVGSIMRLLKEHDTPKQIKHMAMSAFAVLSRATSVKEKAGSEGAIETLVSVLKSEEGATEVTRALALRSIWNEVYSPEHKAILWKQGILPLTLEYLKGGSGQILGQLSCFFILSHMAYGSPEFPDIKTDISASEATMLAVKTISKQLEKPELPDPEHEQCLEAACRMLSTVPASIEKHGSQHIDDVVEALLKAMKTSFHRPQLNAFKIEGTGSWYHDSFKLRAAEALNNLLREEAAGSQAEAMFVQALQLLLQESPEGTSSALAWSASQQEVQRVIHTNKELLASLMGALEECSHEGMPMEWYAKTALLALSGDKTAATLAKYIQVSRMPVGEDNLHDSSIALLGSLTSGLTDYMGDAQAAGILFDCGLVKRYADWLKGSAAYKQYPNKIISVILDAHPDRLEVLTSYFKTEGYQVENVQQLKTLMDLYFNNRIG